VNGIIGAISIKGVYKGLVELNKKIVESFQSVRGELDMHLDSINQNTQEIQSNYGFLEELDSKIDKLNERLDELWMYVNPHFSGFFDIKLNPKEKEIFLIIYASDGRIATKDIGKALNFSDEMVDNYLFSMANKGLPIIKQTTENQSIVCMDLKFRDLQARRNILNIDESLSKRMLSEQKLG